MLMILLDGQAMHQWCLALDKFVNVEIGSSWTLGPKNTQPAINIFPSQVQTLMASKGIHFVLLDLHT
jgi:hypothetical protein